MTQADFAGQILMSRDQLANIETGRTRLRYVEAWEICDWYDIRLDWLAEGPGLKPVYGFDKHGEFPDPRAQCVRPRSTLERVAGWVRQGMEFEAKSARQKAKEARAALRKSKYWKEFVETGSIEESAKWMLTSKAEKLSSADMQPAMPKLLERLRRATEERGRKVKLAAWMRVHPQCITDWLSGRKEPGGETTLRLLHWVQQQERS
jgi:transcriptional regulator with XRE-family HTH domain